MRKGICSRENADRAGVMMMIVMVKHRLCDIGKACVTSVRLGGTNMNIFFNFSNYI